MELFGYSFFDKIDKGFEEREKNELRSVSKDPNDGSIVVTTGDNSNGYEDLSVGDAIGYSMSFDIDPTIVSESQLITRYREISLNHNIEKAVDAIINELVSTDENQVVSLDLDDLDYSDQLKEKIQQEFEYIVNLMDFNNNAFEILKRWYIDGRYQYQIVINENSHKELGIGKLTYLDPRKLKKVRVVNKKKDQRTAADTYADRINYYLYNESGFVNEVATSGHSLSNSPDGVIKLSEESVVQVTSGLLNPTNSVVLSWLHKAIRPLNQLSALEDATIVYRLSRAPERRVFYIDVGNLPPAKAEQVLRRQMNQYKSKMVYDTGSGTVRSDPRHMTMIEDYWLPRRGDGKATEITTLPGGQNLGELSDVNYFLNKLYNSLNVPITRMDPSAGFSLGRSTEITRDEVTLMKFVSRLRRRFASLFLDILKRQLALKNILNPDEFENIRNLITVEFKSDNHFDEMVANEVLEGRLNILDRVNAHVGKFFSLEWVFRNVLRLSEEEMEEMRKQMSNEQKAGMYDDLMGEDGVSPSISRVIHSTDDGKDLAKAANNINSQNKTTTTPDKKEEK